MAHSLPGRSMGGLISDLVGQFQRLAQTEYQMARLEIGTNMKKLRLAGVLLGAAALILLPAITLLLVGVALTLTRAGLPLDIASLAVALVALIAGLCAGSAALNRFKTVNLIPEKALNHLRRDVAAINPVRQNHERAAA